MKELFENYSEQPSEDVWRRLNERLDAEMPVQGGTPVRKRGWIWMAAAVAGLTVGGAIFGLVRHHAGGNPETVGNESQQVVAELQEEAAPEVLVLEEETSEKTACEPLLAEESSATQMEKKVEKVSEPVLREETAAPKANARQIVLPPNSTLAKQLAADPVLKNLSDDSVDWSLPVHFSIPNLFTPNNDGVNDFFVIEGLENYSSPRLVVRDKNNRVVYQNDAYKNTWGGENCPEGVYSYELTFSYNGIENQALGKVRIMRN